MPYGGPTGAEALQLQMSSSEKEASSKKQADESDPLLKLPGFESSPAREYLAFGLGEFFENLRFHFGSEFLVMLFFTQHLAKGFVYSFMGSATPYIYKAYSVPGPQVQVYSAVTSLPWTLKPIIGLASDAFPIMGYRKAPYMLAVTVLGSSSLACVGLITSLSLKPVVLGLIFANLFLSTVDLLSEARYADKMRDVPRHGPALLSYVWFGLNLLTLAAVLLSGPAISALGPRPLYLICAVPAALCLLPTAAGFMDEVKVDAAETAELRRGLFQQGEACGLCILMLLGSLLILAVGLTAQSPVVNCAVSCSVGAVILLAFSVFLSPVIARCNAFAMLTSCFGISISGASFYFYTDDAIAYPAGPHFTPFFFNTVMGCIAQLCSLLGIVAYQRYLTRFTFRTVFMFSQAVTAGLSCLDVMMFARVNVKLGISDHVMVLGASAMENLVAQWNWMPQVLLFSRLCPKGMEAMMYALLAGSANLGSTISSNLGAFVLHSFRIQPTGSQGDAAQFEHLWLVALLATLMPLGAVLLLVPLLPDKRQDEDILPQGQGSGATDGSLWRRWKG